MRNPHRPVPRTLPVKHQPLKPAAILLRAWLRGLLHYPGQMVLAILGIALGIAVVVSIHLAKSSALSAFRQAGQTIHSGASHRIASPQLGGVDEQFYRILRTTPAMPAASPKVSVAVTTQHTDHPITLSGIDPLSEPALLQWSRRSRGSGSNPLLQALWKLLTDPGQAIISRQTADQHGLKVGGNFEIEAAGKKHALKIAHIVDHPDRFERQLLHNRILADIGTAQTIAGLAGKLGYIDIRTGPGTQGEQQLNRLKQILPAGTELQSYDSLARSSEQMTQSFYTNLSALSLLSLLVGLFLIYNTVNYLVLRRRDLTGMLRAIGMTRAQMFGLVLAETLLLGSIGTVSGLILGTVLADRLLALITRTIHNLYFRIPSPLLELDSGTYAAGLITGISAALLAAVLPAIESTRVAPAHALLRSRLETGTRSGVRFSALTGTVTIAAGLVTLLLTSENIEYGFAGLMLLVIGTALLTPWTMVAIISVLKPILHTFGIFGTWPGRSVIASLSRTGYAAAALMVAIATAVGMQIMIASFRLTVHNWLNLRLNADLYVSAAGSADSGPRIPPEFREKLRSLDGIRDLSSVLVASGGNSANPVQLNVYELSREAYRGFRFQERTDHESWDGFRSRDQVLISEPFAYKNGLRAGSSLALVTPSGNREFRIAGVYTDYNPGNGIVAISRATYSRHWSDPRYSGFWVYLEAYADTKQVERRISALATDTVPLNVTSQKEIVEFSLQVFDQAFAITRILQWLATGIAFIGVFSALMAIQLERSREFGILRSQGITPSQLTLLICTECGLTGFIAGLLAIPTGASIATVLVYVINRRSFGWTMDIHMAPEIWVEALLTGTLAAVLAGLYPAVRMARMSPARALRME